MSATDRPEASVETECPKCGAPMTPGGWCDSSEHAYEGPETIAERRRAARLLPGGVPRYVRIYDSGPDSTADRYTAVFGGRWAGRPAGTWSYRGMSADPYSPQGVGASGELPAGPCRLPEADEHGSTRHLGKRVPWNGCEPGGVRVAEDLPERVRECILQDYFDLWDIHLPPGLTRLEYCAGHAADADTAGLAPNIRPRQIPVRVGRRTRELYPWLCWASTDDVRTANRQAGGHFFDVGTMRSFRSHVGRDILGGRYFLTSERPVCVGQRVYRVRAATPGGRLRTVGNPHRSLRLARVCALEYARAGRFIAEHGHKRARETYPADVYAEAARRG